MVGPICISANDESHQPTHHRQYRHWMPSHVFHTPNMNDKDSNDSEHDSEHDSDTLQQCSTD
jgi:hypothetical protein